MAGDGDPNVFLVVDRSAAMGVEDLPDGRDRMAGARDDIADCWTSTRPPASP